jgi:hypothetical protein
MRSEDVLISLDMRLSISLLLRITCCPLLGGMSRKLKVIRCIDGKAVEIFHKSSLFLVRLIIVMCTKTKELLSNSKTIHLISNNSIIQVILLFYLISLIFSLGVYHLSAKKVIIILFILLVTEMFYTLMKPVDNENEEDDDSDDDILNN